MSVSPCCRWHRAAHPSGMSFRNVLHPVQQKENSVMQTSRPAFIAKPGLWGYLQNPAPQWGVFLMSKFTQHLLSARVHPGVVFLFPFWHTGVTWCKLYLLSFVRMEGKSAFLSSGFPPSWLEKRKMSRHFPQQRQTAGPEVFVLLQMLPDLSDQPDPLHLWL